MSRRNKKQLGTIKKLLILVVACLLLFLLINKVDSTLKIKDIREAVAWSRVKNEPKFDNTRNKNLTRLKNAGLIRFDHPVFSSKTDVCLLNTDGSFGSSYHQDCYIRYIDGFPIDISSEDTETIIKNRLVDPQNDNFYPYKDECGTDFDYGDEIRLTYLLKIKQSVGDYCRALNPIEGTHTRGPGILFDMTVTHTLRSFNPDMIDQSFAYLVVEYEAYYIERLELGCGFGTLCPPPVKKAITDFN